MLRISSTGLSRGLSRHHQSFELSLSRAVGAWHSFSSKVVSENTEGYQASRPVQWRHRVRDFPSNVKKLYDDMWHVMAIRDAAQSPKNIWKGRIPRRQREEQRKFVQDLRIVLPVVIIWIPPIIGFLPMFGAIFAPRQVLSRQFHNPYEKHHFSYLEYLQRKSTYGNISTSFWSSLETSPQLMNLSILKSDVAGPVFDLYPLFQRFHESSFLRDFDSYQGEQITNLALASGYCQRFPKPVATLMTKSIPSWCLRVELNQMSSDIVKDDAVLIEEHYHKMNCQGLTDEETVEASLVRGLPVTGQHKEMRIAMTNHLTMMEDLRNKIDVRDKSVRQSLQLFTIHLAAIRSNMK